ncbi:MAG TPA: TIM-barrel domain-containing protein [Kofleriaceae bacterium]|nr:TIM-barrel domain-containing protein [Kofleriaceae bacterium]
MRVHPAELEAGHELVGLAASLLGAEVLRARGGRQQSEGEEPDERAQANHRPSLSCAAGPRQDEGTGYTLVPMSLRTVILACVVASASVLAAGCAAEPVEAVLSGIVVRVEPDPARLVFAQGGKLLLEGLTGGSVGEQKPPHVAAAFRAGQATYETLYGSFRVEDNARGWLGARRFSHIVAERDRIRFTIEGSDGATSAGEVRAVADGTLQIVLGGGAGMNRASAAFRCRPDEHFLGFGAQTHDVDHRGQTVPIWVSEQGIGKIDHDDPPGDWFYRGTRHSSYFPVPFFVSSAGYGVRADTAQRSQFAMCSEGAEVWRIEAWEGTLSFHLFAGPTPLDVIRRHGDLSGRAPAPPAFAWAPWNDAVHGSANVRRVAQLLRAKRIPSSAIWTEDWAGGIQTGNNYNLTYKWSVDRGQYPDVEQLAADLHATGFKFLGYFNTFVEKEGDNYAPGLAGGFLIKQQDGTPYLFSGVRFTPTTMVDLSNPAARDWMAAAMSETLRLGFDGWMADYGEWLPVDAQGADPAVHNRYPVLWQELNARVLADKPDALSFVRSGFTGSQAVPQQVVWAGDQSTDFDPNDGLPTVIPLGIGLGVSGLPYFGSDIAGYYTAPEHAFVTKELFLRWSALGALTPIMRTHHGVAAGKNWTFESDPETLAHYKRWAEVHIRLYPYLLAAAREAAITSTPMVRALALGFPGDGKAWPVKDQFLLGPALLVAPVVTEGAMSRGVYLPEGHWFRVFGDDEEPARDGPAMFEVAAPPGELPVFARAGTVIVMLPEGVETLAPAAPPVRDLDDVGDSRELLVLLGRDGSASEPNGRTYAWHSAAAAPTGASLTFNGKPVAACTTAPVSPPCGQVDLAERHADVTVSGAGSLVLDDAGMLALTGGRADRLVTVRLRW